MNIPVFDGPQGNQVECIWIPETENSSQITLKNLRDRIVDGCIASLMDRAFYFRRLDDDENKVSILPKDESRVPVPTKAGSLSLCLSCHRKRKIKQEEGEAEVVDLCDSEDEESLPTRIKREDNGKPKEEENSTRSKDRDHVKHEEPESPPEGGPPKAESTRVRNQQQPDEKESVTNNPNIQDPVKQEKAKKDLEAAMASACQKYGNRQLLQRMEKGIGKLGGNVQNTYVVPAKGNKYIWDELQILRPEYPLPERIRGSLEGGELPDTMDHFGYMCYDSLWQVNGPKFAGQPHAAVDGVPDFIRLTDHAIPVFMKRTRTTRDSESEGALLGWEYVGNYKCIDDPDMVVWDSALNFTKAMKNVIAKKYVKSASSKSGETYGRMKIDKWKRKLEDELNQDQSEAAPLYLLEDRAPTEQELKAPKPSLAARARALGFNLDASFPDKDIADIMVRLDEFHRQFVIEFVEYDERIYEYCVKNGGATTRDRNGKMRRNTGASPATAGDWYQFAQQYMLM